MPPAASIDAVIAKLRGGVASSRELEQAFNASQSWVSRALRKLTDDGQVLRLGTTRGARYGLRREIEGIGSAWPLRRIDQTSGVHEIGTLYCLAADQYYFDPHPTALAAGFAWGGISDGLPYFLQDQRPGGFLGRAVPLRHPELNLPQRVMDWTDDHYLRYLTQQGWDAAGDLILGKDAFNRYLTGLNSRPQIPALERNLRYPQLATEVMQGGLPGSSARGEHPKFSVVLNDSSVARPVIVKFSPPMSTPVGRRWADLLITEYHAHRILREAGYPACTSQVMAFDDRMYLETDRFDRAGINGRVGVTSLWALDTTQYGQLDNWIDSALRLHRDRRIDADTLEQIRLVATFGALIANTDRHFGNLSLLDVYGGRFQLAPIYDMLPMLFAPEHDQILDRVFAPPDPDSDTLRVWPRARELAHMYWRTVAEDSRISSEFREIAAKLKSAKRKA